VLWLLVFALKISNNINQQNAIMFLQNSWTCPVLDLQAMDYVMDMWDVQKYYTLTPTQALSVYFGQVSNVLGSVQLMPLFLPRNEAAPSHQRSHTVTSSQSMSITNSQAHVPQDRAQ
jgi:hypothetical protein